MILVKIGFKKMSEGLKQYNPGDKPTHFSKKDEAYLVNNGYAEYVKTEKKEVKKKPTTKKAVKK